MWRILIMAGNKYILNLTPTGMIPTKEMTPHVPVTPNEIIEDVLRAASLGITMVHLHARDPANGKPAYEKASYMVKSSRESERKIKISFCVFPQAGELITHLINVRNVSNLKEN